MSSLKAAYLNELYKISKKKKIVVAAILSLVVIIVACLVVSGVRNFMGINIAGGSDFSVTVLMFLNYTLIPLFTAFLCIDMFTGELSDETVKLTLTRPVSRFKLYLAKTLAAGSFILANLLFVMVLSIIFSFIAGGRSVSFVEVIVSYLVSFFPLMVCALLSIFVANFARGTGSAFLITVVLYLLSLGLGFFYPQISSFLFTSSFDWYILFNGTYINWLKILRTFLILVGYILALFSAGYVLYERKDI